VDLARGGEESTVGVVAVTGECGCSGFYVVKYCAPVDLTGVVGELERQ
jgi:hypothetical protein